MEKPTDKEMEQILYAKLDQLQPYRRLWLVTMENGTQWTAKPIHDKKHLLWWMKVDQQLRDRGFPAMPSIWTDEDKWQLTPFIKGKTCSYRNFDEAAKAIICLATFHMLGQQLPVPPLQKRAAFLLYDRLYERIHSFYKQLNSMHYIEGEWGEFLRHYVPLFYDDALTAWDHLQSSGMYEYTAKSVNNRSIAHRDLANHNWLLDQKGKMWLIDFETAGYDAQIGDLWQMMARILCEQQWSPAVFQQLMSKYETIKPLQPHEKKLLYRLLAFPNDFMRESIGLWKRKPGYSVRSTVPFLQKIANMRNQWKEFLKQIFS